ncbi:hypothetical protein CLV63_10581 [Murinocardiopsis flavida]|uniref:NmrA-like family protein n=1 Tax=Murinocardiopsis flavida TaxID=645275 RepID=A0A2P8DMH8_9ACTN|nr:hypothetical protein [Murinocardiopsis flavida]PSK98407.1 hypothetical protein CLV63_10581 [Murinocardiopsis flavida]
MDRRSGGVHYAELQRGRPRRTGPVRCGRAAGRIHEVTGPRLLTFAAAVAEIATQLADLMAGVLDGRRAAVTDTVRRVLGRSPRDFAEYARTTAATGAWDPRAGAAGAH